MRRVSECHGIHMEVSGHGRKGGFIKGKKIQYYKRRKGEGGNGTGKMKWLEGWKDRVEEGIQEEITDMDGLLKKSHRNLSLWKLLV